MTCEYKIQLERTEAVYFAGEFIRGTIEVLSDNSKYNYKTSTYAMLFKKEFDCDYDCLCSSHFIDVYGDLKCYKFSLQIPPHSYTTCFTAYRKYRYSLVVGIGHWYKPEDIRTPVTIIRPLDLQRYSYIYGKHWQLASGVAAFKCQLDHAAYAAGQNVNYQLNVPRSWLPLWQYLKIRIMQTTKSEILSVLGGKPEMRSYKSCAIIAENVIKLKYFWKEESKNYAGALHLPRGIALSSEYPIYRIKNCLALCPVYVEYFVEFLLLSKCGLKRRVFGGNIIVGSAPLNDDKSETSKEIEPSTFCMDQPPKNNKIAYIPHPKLTS